MSRTKWAIWAAVFTILFIAFTFAVMKVDVQQFRLSETETVEIGFGKINIKLRNAIDGFGQKNLMEKLSTGIMALGFGFVFVLGIVWLVQIFKERSFTGLDCELYVVFLICIISAALYLFFEKFVINYRPVLGENGKPAASYPSSHVLFTMVTVGCPMLFLRVRVISNTARRWILVLGWVLMLAGIATRVLSGQHWASDIAGSFLLGCTLLLWYETIACTCKKRILKLGGNGDDHEEHLPMDARHAEYEREDRDYRQ